MWPLQDNISLLGWVSTIQHSDQPPGLMREKGSETWMQLTVNLAFVCSLMHSDIASWLL